MRGMGGDRSNRLWKVAGTSLSIELPVDKLLHELARQGRKGAAARDFVYDSEPVRQTLMLDLMNGEDPLREDEAGIKLADAVAAGTVCLTSLSLVQAGLSEAGARALALALPARPTLTRLDLTGNRRMGSTGTADLTAAALRRESSVEYLSLYDTCLGPAGAKAVAKLLRENQTITHLDLSTNAIGKDGTDEIAAALDDPWGAVQTYEASRKKAHEVGGQSDLADKDLKHPPQNASIKRLELGNNLIGDGGCQALASMLLHNVHLTYLDLYANGITHVGADELCSGLSSNAALCSLGLEDDPIGERGAKALASMLRTNKTLRSLSVFGREIGEGGVIALSFALRETNSTLTRLDLSSWQLRQDPTPMPDSDRPRKFGERGVKALAAVLAHNTGLQHLNIEGNGCGDAGARALISSLAHNRTLLSLGGLCDENELTSQCKAEVDMALLVHRRQIKTSYGAL